MYIKNFIQQFNDKKLKIFVDMDGVIVDYILNDLDYSNKRPLTSNIKKLEEISKMNNTELYILSVSRTDKGVEQKHVWLDEFAPIFKKENRVIISIENNDLGFASKIKTNYLKNLKRDGNLIIVIDDDPRVLKDIYRENKDIILLKDSALID